MKIKKYFKTRRGVDDEQCIEFLFIEEKIKRNGSKTIHSWCLAHMMFCENNQCFVLLTRRRNGAGYITKQLPDKPVCILETQDEIVAVEEAKIFLEKLLSKGEKR